MPFLLSQRSVYLTLLLLAFCESVVLSQATAPPKLGQIERSWFDDNPYAADSSVHAYVIGTHRKAVVQLNQVANRYQMVTRHRRIVRVVDEQGFEEATVRLRLYQPKGGQNVELLDELKGFSHTIDADRKLTTTPLGADAAQTTRLSPDVVETAFSFPGVRAGTVLDLEYVVVSDYIAQPDPVYFQEGIPVQQADFELVSDQRFAYKALMLGYNKIEDGYEKKQTNSGGIRGESAAYNNILTFSASDLPALHEEPYITTLNNYRSQVLLELERYARGTQIVDRTTSWGDIALTLREAEGMKPALRSNRFYKDWAATYTGPDDVEARINWAFAELGRRLRWNGRYSRYPDERAQGVTSDATGTSAELNVQLLGLLRALDVAASPVYISTREHGYLRESLPTLGAINHLIVGVKGDNDAVTLIDAINPTTIPGLLPYGDLNGTGLFVEDNTEGFIKLQAKAYEQTNLLADLTLDDQGYLEGEVRLTLRDYGAFPYTQLRGDSLYLDLDDFKGFDGYEVTQLNSTKTGEYSFDVTAHLKSRTKAIDLGGVLGVNPAVFPTFSQNPLDVEDRAYPVELPYRLVNTRKVTIHLPKGASLEEPPAPVAAVLPDRSCSYQYKVTSLPEQNTVSITSSLVVNKLVHPPSEYGQIHQLFKMAAGAETALLSIKL